MQVAALNNIRTNNVYHHTMPKAAQRSLESGDRITSRMQIYLVQLDSFIPKYSELFGNQWDLIA